MKTNIPKKWMKHGRNYICIFVIIWREGWKILTWTWRDTACMQIDDDLDLLLLFFPIIFPFLLEHFLIWPWINVNRINTIVKILYTSICYIIWVIISILWKKTFSYISRIQWGEREKWFYIAIPWQITVSNLLVLDWLE